MKAKTLVLLPVFLIVLSSCACKPTIEYVDRVQYLVPEVPKLAPVEYPKVQLEVWGDYSIYKAQCEAQINLCNLNMETIVNSITTELVDETD